MGWPGCAPGQWEMPTGKGGAQGQAGEGQARLLRGLPFPQVLSSPWREPRGPTPPGQPRKAPLELTVAAGVVGEAGAAQLREAHLTSAAVPAGAFATQAALVTPVRGHGARCHLGKRPVAPGPHPLDPKPWPRSVCPASGPAPLPQEGGELTARWQEPGEPRTGPVSETPLRSPGHSQALGVPDEAPPGMRQTQS